MTSISTKFGTAKINDNGYYMISTSKEGNHKKLLHRLIYEDYYKVCLLPNVIIHHIDRNKQNNNVKNLFPIYLNDHTKFHHTGMPNIKQSKLDGLPYRVSLEKDNRYSQGYRYKYRYNVNGKTKKITSTDMDKLHDKVISKNLTWNWLDCNNNQNVLL